MRSPEFINRRNLGLMIWFCVFLVLGFSLGGCNTVKGFANDLNSIATGIQNEMSNGTNE